MDVTFFAKASLSFGGIDSFAYNVARLRISDGSWKRTQAMYPATMARADS